MKLKPYTVAPFLAVLTYLSTVCAGQILGDLDAGTNTYLYLFAGIQLAAYLLPLLIYALLFGGLSPKRMRIALPEACSIPLQALLLIILLIGTALISMLLERVGIVFPETASGGFDNPGLLAIAVAAIVPAVCEEILFRGVIMSAFEPCGIAPAIIGSSLLFAFGHMSLEKLPLYFFAGVILAFSVYVGRSVFVSVFLHAVYNVASLCLGDYLSAVAAHLESFALLFIILFFALWIIVLIALSEGSRVYGIYAERSLDSSYTPEKMNAVERAKGNAAVYLSVPFLLATVIYVAALILSMKEII